MGTILELHIPRKADSLVNINTATVAELSELPGVGPGLAKAIEDHRAARGPFRAVGDIGCVPGMGPKRVDKILSRICVDAGAAPAVADREPARVEPARVITFPPAAQPTPRPAAPAPLDAAARVFGDDDNDIQAPDGWEWTPGQVEAIRLIRRHLRGRAGKVFVMAGYAGTGKTTLLIEALRPFPSPVMIAPTHKAAAILAPKAEKLGGRTATVASFLGYRAVLNKQTGEEEFRRVPQDPRRIERMYPKHAPIIIDEASMIGAQQWAEIVEECERRALRVIAMGDPLQLPPVGESVSPAFSEGATIELTEVKRSQGILTQVVLGVRARIEQDAPPIIRAAAKDPTGEIIVAPDRQTFLRSYLAAIRAGSDAMIVAYTNKAVDWCNAAIRGMLAGADPRPFVPGEVLVTLRPWREEVEAYDEHGDPAPVERVIPTETRVIVRSAVRLTHPIFGDDCWRLDVQRLGFSASASLLDGTMPTTDDSADSAEGEEDDDAAESPASRIIAEDDRFTVFALDDRQAKPVADRLRNLKAELAALDKAGQVRDRDLKAAQIANYRSAYYANRPGYATTVHKSQGSTWEHAFVLQGDICKNQQPLERNRLLYVAYSRAAKRITVFG